MPIFPRYNSQEQLTTQRPQPLAPEDAEGAVQGQLAKTFQSAQDSVVKLDKAQRSMRDTQAEYNTQLGLLDIAAKAEASTDINGYDKFAAEVDKNLEQSGAGGTDAFLKLKYESQAAKIKLKGLFLQKQIINDNVNTEAQLKLLSKDPNPESFGEIGALLKKKAGLGFYKEDKAATLQTQYEKDWKQNKFLGDIDSGTANARQNLKENTYGFDLKEMDNAEKILSAAENKEIEQRKQVQFDTAVDASLKLVDGSLTQDEIRGMVLDGTMDSDLAGAMEIGLYSPNQLKGQKPGVAAQMYIDMVDKMDKFDPATATDVLKNAIKDFSSTNPNINKVDLAMISKTIDNKRKDPQNPIWSALKGAVRSSIPPAAILEFFGVWDQKSDPAPVMNKAINDTYKKADPRAGKFIVGRKYPQGYFLGFNEETGKLKFGKSKESNA